jgi:hypothetical protein
LDNWKKESVQRTQLEWRVRAPKDPRLELGKVVVISHETMARYLSVGAVNQRLINIIITTESLVYTPDVIG